MNDRDEEMAIVSARECAGFNSTATVRVFVVDPCLNHEGFDEIHFETLDDAIEYIQEHVGECIACNYTDDDFAKSGFNLKLFSKFVSQEMHEAVFKHGETVDVDDCQE